MNMEHVGSFKGQGTNLGPFEAKMLSESGETKESKEVKETAELLDSAFSDHLNFHRIGWWENLQESPIFDGKNHDFPLNQSIWIWTFDDFSDNTINLNELIMSSF